MLHWVCHVLLSFSLLAPSALLAATQPPRVVISLAPIHSLIAGVMQGVATPSLLIPASTSHHHASLRPSQIRALQQAELIIRIGPYSEGFLNRVLDSLAPGHQVMVITALPDIQLLPARSGGLWESHGHATGDGHDHGAEGQAPGEQETDQHLWLDPRNAQVIVTAAAERLGRMDPAHAALYEQNAVRLRMRLARLEQALQDRLTPLRQSPYLVLHDAYQYFEQRFGLHPVGAITIDPELRPGARRILELRQWIQQTQARCLFSEPQFSPKSIQAISRGLPLNIGIMDPLGMDLEPGEALYFILLEKLADALVDCLQPETAPGDDPHEATSPAGTNRAASSPDGR